MAINGTEAERRDVAADQLAKKMKLERRFIISMREYFRQISIDFRALYARTGTVVRATDYMDDLRGILSTNYRRVSRAFQGSLVKWLRDNANNQAEAIIQNLTLIAQGNGRTLIQLINDLEQEMITQSTQLITQSVDADSKFITQTTQNELNNSVLFAIPLLTDQLGKAPTTGEIAIVSARKFRQNSVSRSNTIAATGTQKIAEGTKDIEFNTFLSVRNSDREILPPLDDQLIWVTMGDKKVRRGEFSHVSADSQIRRGGVFTVSGESLRFPGDAAMGASIGNLANCRCAAIPTINDQPIAEL